MANTPRMLVGDHFCVGPINSLFLDSGLSLFPGSAVINGPVYCGAFVEGPPRSSMFIGQGFTGLPALEVVGISNVFGTFNVYALSQFTGITKKFGLNFKFAASIKNGPDLKNSLNCSAAPSIFSAPVKFNAPIIGNVNVIGTLTATSVGGAIKNFIIDHPSKPGYKLIHSCLEGPENGVYYRGRLEDNNKIVLPDYWENLINPDTITVHLTPKRYHQELYVKSIDWGKIINIVNNSGGSIDCDYIVYAERIDVEKLQVEVKE